MRKKNRTIIKKARRVVVLNPRGKHLPGATAKQNRQYEHILKSELDRGTPLKDAKRIAAATVRAGAKNPSKRIKIGNSQKYTDLVIRGKAKKTPQGWRLAGKTFPQGRGTTKVSSGYYLDRHTGLVYAKRERSNPRRRRSRPNPARISQADIAKFPPHIQAQLQRQIGAIQDKEEKAAAAPAETPAQRKKLIKQYRSIEKQKKSLLQKIVAKMKHLAGPSSQKITASEARRGKRFQNAGKRRNPSYTVEAIPKYTKTVKDTINAFSRGSAIRKIKRQVEGPKNIYRYRVEKNPSKRRRRSNETPEQIRKEFAGSVSGHRDLYFPEGTPQGLAKLGKLISITTEEGTIKPVAGSAWLCADTKGHLHLGSTSGAPLYDGPKRDFGEVSKIEYEDLKKHLGYTKPTIFFHHVGERTGERPTLHADGRGGLVFRGGAYWIGPRGLEN
ncbi:MAG: hypothetical protein J2P41_00180 [Blastocatellia bacterium]|nr:hypothetical protein [Blastocatellia bacterium]